LAQRDRDRDHLPPGRPRPQSRKRYSRDASPAMPRGRHVRLTMRSTMNPSWPLGHQERLPQGLSALAKVLPTPEIIDHYLCGRFFFGDERSPSTMHDSAVSIGSLSLNSYEGQRSGYIPLNFMTITWFLVIPTASAT